VACTKRNFEKISSIDAREFELDEVRIYQHIEKLQSFPAKPMYFHSKLSKKILISIVFPNFIMKKSYARARDGLSFFDKS